MRQQLVTMFEIFQKDSLRAPVIPAWWLGGGVRECLCTEVIYRDSHTLYTTKLTNVEFPPTNVEDPLITGQLNF